MARAPLGDSAPASGARGHGGFASGWRILGRRFPQRVRLRTGNEMTGRR